MFNRIRRSLALKVTWMLVLALGVLLSVFIGLVIQRTAALIEDNLLSKGKGMAHQGAVVVSQIFESAIANGELTLEDAFDENYVAIPGTEPAKYRTRFDAFTDKAFLTFEDTFIKDPQVIFAAAADRNGYIPTHNSKFSPALTGDVSKDMANRTKRLFNDPVGLSAARNTAEETLVQLYKRDTGEVMWDISSPIIVQGRHWGAFRVGFSKATIDALIADFVMRMVLTALGIVLLLSLSIYFLLKRSLKPLGEMVGAIERIAEGDLDQRVEVRSQDEIGVMAKDFNGMVAYLHEVAAIAGAIGQGDMTRTLVPKSERDQFGRAISQMVGNLGGIIRQVREVSGQVSESSSQTRMAVNQTSEAMELVAASIAQVSDNAQSLAVAVEETSSSIEEMAASIQQVAGNADTLGAAVSQTSASIEEMAASVKQVAGNVAEANRVAEHSSTVAQEGRQAVEQTISGMQRINVAMSDVVSVIERLGNSSEEIGAIVSVIDDIAEQTNLLALNAAIEAARAGEHGRGFAVVADEVRKLAERSAQATGEIATLIKGIQKETEHAVASTQHGSSAIARGTQLAQSAGESLGAIVTAVGQVSTLMQQIAQATSEQDRAASQITQAVSAMSALTHQVTAATHEQAKGSEQIIKAVESMNRMTQQVSSATSEQRQGGERVVQAVSNISRLAGDLQGEAHRLLDEVSVFQLEGATLRVPAAPPALRAGH